MTKSQVDRQAYFLSGRDAEKRWLIRDIVFNDPDVSAFLLEKSTTVEIGNDYVEMRLKGESHSVSKICATRRSPALSTDSTFLSGHVNGSQFSSCAAVGHHHKAVAEYAGVSTSGCVYMAGLARYPGDPEAWVSGKGDVARVAEKRGWGVEGAVTVSRRQTEPMDDTLVGTDIVDEATGMIQAMHPELTQGEAREQATRLRSGQGRDDRLRVAPVPEEAFDLCPDF